jgi:hypothetical protein
LWSLLALLSSLVVPGLSIAFVLPAATGLASLAIASRALRNKTEITTSGALLMSLGPCMAILVWVPLIYGVELAFGLGVPAGVLGLQALLLTTLAPLLLVTRGARTRPLWLALAVVTLGFGFYASRQPEFSAIYPQPLNIVLHEDRREEAAATRWIAHAWDMGEGLPPALVTAGFERGAIGAPPWGASRVYSAPAEPTEVASPTITIIRTEMTGEGRRVLLRVGERASSGRGPGSVMLLLPADALASRELHPANAVSGTSAPVSIQPGRSPLASHAAYTFYGLPVEGVELWVTLARTRAVTGIVIMASYGLPANARALVDARDAGAMPRQHGDLHLISADFTL